MGHKYLYFVEGECERAFLKSFMYTKKYGFVPGKVEVFNFVNSKMSVAQSRMIKKDSKVVIVIDTDVTKNQTLDENIKTLTIGAEVKRDDIYIIQSVKTFEDELVYSCPTLKNINDLFETKSVSDFKKRFIKHSDIVSRLEKAKFDIKLIWTRIGQKPFGNYENNSQKIKRVK